ncbi:hypothetical protein ACIP98_18540 [Streptomyces sp. NPDC088354]|uniref:hypothetical protein n=1 Tax=unclassified Streptomyces TaxID=2593676 RepID=UPI0029B481C2|nr:hypothetical protein [Streptomyces sp. MI02-7b]MDX3072695.1 hypothetical protein [Streptomyces sp. MI02-7b]
MDVIFPVSAYPPLALGFFGLGTGYLIWGPQELFGWPKRDERVDRALGTWGIWLPGFCQLLAGVILFVGLTWFEVFKAPSLYMAALAFSAYGIHWFALGWDRYRGNDPRVNAGVSVAYMVLSALGATVFFAVNDWPVGIVFIGLFGVYAAKLVMSVGVPVAERVMGLFRVLTACWLMYLTFAVVVDFALGYHWPT